MKERIGEIGYLAGDDENHALISIYGAALINPDLSDRSIQVAISIDGAIKLRAELDVFLKGALAASA